MYYRLQTEPSLQAGYIREEANRHETLLGGDLVDEGGLTLPWPFTVVVDPEEGLAMSDYYPGKRLMSKRLVAALESGGVDNTQVFPAEMKKSDTGEVIHDFVVVNVIGMVSCADLDASNSSPLADVRFFHKLVLDPERTRGLLMFRLAE